MSFVYNVVLILGKTRHFSSSFDFSFQMNSNTLVTRQIRFAVQQNGKIRSISHYSLRRSLSMKRCRVRGRVSLGKETGTQSFPQSRWVLLVYFERLILPQWQSVNACSACGLTIAYPALGTSGHVDTQWAITPLPHINFFRWCFRKCGVFSSYFALEVNESLAFVRFYSFFVSWKNGDKCVTRRRLKIPQRRQRHNGEHLMKFRLVIVWCLVPCIYKII